MKTMIKLTLAPVALVLLALSGCGTAPEGLPDGPIKYLVPCPDGLPDGPIAYFGPDMEPVAPEDAAIACDQAGTCCALEQ
jgi:hypothetical protein